MNFPTSTHKSRWLLSPGDLEARRCARYEKSVREIERYRPASTSAAAAAEPEEGEAKAPQQLLGDLELVSMEEEKKLFSYYERMISKICVLYHFPRKIMAISLVYFKRFYLKFSILDYEPWTLMITCVYLACKVENAYISAEELAKGVQQDARIVEKIVLGSEMNLLQGLDFDLVVHTPYAALDGFCFDLETYVQVSHDTTRVFRALPLSLSLSLSRATLSPRDVTSPENGRKRASNDEKMTWLM